MPTFVMLTGLNPDAVRSPRGLEQLERDAMKRVRQECPDVEWLSSYAILGPYDYLDVFIANNIETAARVSTRNTDASDRPRTIIADTPRLVSRATGSSGL